MVARKRVTPKINAYAVIARAVEEGIGWGYRRAHKHEDHPSEDAMRDHMEREVMNALCEVLDLGD